MPLNKEQIIAESLQLLNESGIENVTLRKIAKKLGVHASALYWHFDDKEGLINEMAEAILQKEFAGIRSGDAEEGWLGQTFNRLRKALLAYKDGARVVAGAHLSLTMAKISEASIATLVAAGQDLHQARLVVLTANHYTFGYVIEEQTTLSPKAAKKFNLEEFQKSYPLLIEGISEYFATGRTVDDLFNDGLRIIIGK